MTQTKPLASFWSGLISLACHQLQHNHQQSSILQALLQDSDRCISFWELQSSEPAWLSRSHQNACCRGLSCLLEGCASTVHSLNCTGVSCKASCTVRCLHQACNKDTMYQHR